MLAELRLLDEVGQRPRRRDRAAAVVLRTAPAGPPDDVLHDGPQGPLPDRRRRPPAALDGVRRRPRRRGRSAPSWSSARPGAAGGSPTPGRTRSTRSSPPSPTPSPPPGSTSPPANCASRRSSAAPPPPPTRRSNAGTATSPSCTCSASSGTTIACDISAAQRELGYEPSVGLAEGMRRSVDWCLAQGMQAVNDRWSPVATATSGACSSTTSSSRRTASASSTSIRPERSRRRRT